MWLQYLGWPRHDSWPGHDSRGGCSQGAEGVHVNLSPEAQCHRCEGFDIHVLMVPCAHVTCTLVWACASSHTTLDSCTSYLAL